MRRPSLKALQAFSLAAEKGSVKQAAEQLGISPSAVSHLITSLENNLEAALLDRSKHGFALTPEGRSLGAETSQAFGQIDRALQPFQPREQSELRISAPPSFATNWLIPRLPRFNEQHPETTVLISAQSRCIDLGKEACDLAIRWGDGHWPELESTLLWQEQLACVVAARHRGCSELPALLELPQLQTSAFPQHWAQWLEAQTERPLSVKPGTIIETRSNVITTTLAGLGAAILDPRLIERELNSGLLIEPINHRVTLNKGYWLVRHPQRSLRPAAQQFSSWITEEVSNHSPS